MRNLILTLAATATLLVGGLTWTDTAEARPRGWYRSAPAVRYYRPYYGYRAYNRPYYGYPYGSYYYGRPYVGGRVYFNWR
jgi:hypothetical protein